MSVPQAGSVCAGRHRPDREQRNFERTLCTRRIRITIFALGAKYDGIIWDLSDQGLGLVCAHQLPAGTAIAIQHREEPIHIGVIEATVKHTTDLPDRSYFIGCQLKYSLARELRCLFLSED